MSDRDATDVTIELHAERFGVENGSRVLVLLHGFGGTHHVWQPVIGDLMRRAPDLTVLAYDLPGHGANLNVPKAGPAKLAAQLIAADLSRRGIERFHLGGHSMGGAVSALIAVAEPERIASLSLVAPGGFGPEIDIEGLKRFAAATDERSLRACLAEMNSPDAAIADDEIASLVEMRARPGQTEMLQGIADTMTRDGKQGQIPKKWFAELPMPVALLWGTADSVLPYGQTEGIPAHFALHTIVDAGHMLPGECPQTVGRILGQTIR